MKFIHLSKTRTGVASLRDEAARHTNPLTFLPGNIPTTEHLERLIDGGEPFTVVHVDLTDFKPFYDDQDVRSVTAAGVAKPDTKLG
jgi:GGDEF domain-containing protein